MPSKDAENPKKVDRIVDADISEQMRTAYLDYAMSVITSRALPDMRDGLKPVARRILYAMHGMGLSSGAKTRKSAAVVGEVLGKYHPHGNMAVYDTMVKLAQTFSTRYPLVIGQGNFGSIDGDLPAAERYTEAKLSKLSEEMLRDIDKETIDWTQNYENTRKEPTVLPAVPPNLLLNGTFGIAVGMATNIPPHNLGEVCDAIMYSIENNGATNEDLLKFVKGPDFPLGGIAYDKKAIKKAYETGRGGVVVRGEVEVVENDKTTSIVISSIPFRVNKAELISKIGMLVRDKKIEGVKDLRDESADDIRIVIDLKNSTQPLKIQNVLYKHTQVEETFHYNMVALLDGAPQTLSLSQIIDSYINHRREVIERRTRFELKRAKEREHILSGLKKALDHIDEIITLIKKAKDVSDAKASLIKKYKFSDIQADAILEMKLSKLAGLERKKVENELKEVKDLIKSLESILADRKKIDQIIKEDLEEMRDKYSDKRRTKIVATGIGSMEDEDLIPEERSVLMLTGGGYVKRTLPDEYKRQKRGGVGTKGEVKSEDFITISVSGSTHDTLFFFTDKGKVYQIKMYDIPGGKRTTKGRSLANFISVDADEIVTSVVLLPQDSDKSSSVFFVTEKGTVKRVGLDQFKNIRKTGIIALTLDKGDRLVRTILIDEGKDIFMISKNGKSIRFPTKEIRTSGRSSKGVRGMNLGKGDIVVDAISIDREEKGSSVVTISENGYGKKTKNSLFKSQKRGGSGIKAMEITEKTGSVVASYILSKEEGDFVTMSKDGKVNRISTNEIPDRGRQTKGVKIMKLKDNDKITSVTYL